MKQNDEVIELIGSTEVVEHVQERVKTTGVRGLSLERARDYGLFNRISNLLCVMHSSICAAYRIYGGIDCLLSNFGARKNDIAKACNDFERAYDKFLRFWTDYYKKGEVQKEVNMEVETLFHQLMRWAQLPEGWQLGDDQHTSLNDTNNAIKVEYGDNQLTFNNCVVNEKIIGDAKESWCVTRYEPKNRKQVCVEERMDKASALMVAKRLSDDDKENIYTASFVRDVVESRTEITPYKAFKDNQTIGRLTKQFK